MPKKITKGLIAVIIVLFFGFFLNELFTVVEFFLQQFSDFFIFKITGYNVDNPANWYVMIKHFAFIVLVGIISRLVFKSKLHPILKASYLVPTFALIYSIINSLLSNFTFVNYLVSFYFFVGALYALRKSKLNWLYSFSLIAVSTAVILSMIS